MNIFDYFARTVIRFFTYKLLRSIPMNDTVKEIAIVLVISVVLYFLFFKGA